MTQDPGDQAHAGGDERDHKIVLGAMDRNEKTDESEDPARDIEIRDIFHFFGALKKPDWEKRVAEHRTETQSVDHPVVPELRDKKNRASEDR